MLGEKDVSIFGRLKDKINTSSFAQFKLYIAEKLEYIKDKIEPIKSKLLGNSSKLALNESNTIDR